MLYREEFKKKKKAVTQAYQQSNKTNFLATKENFF